MKLFKSNYIVIPSIALFCMILGKYFSASGMEWYRALWLPFFTPPNWVFPVVWNAIYVMTIASVMLVWNRFERNAYFRAIICLFVMNVFFHVLWTYLFFYNHAIGWALIDAVLLQLTLIALVSLLWARSKIASLLLVPYALWCAFAIVLNAFIWLFN